MGAAPVAPEGCSSCAMESRMRAGILLADGVFRCRAGGQSMRRLRPAAIRRNSSSSLVCNLAIAKS